MFEFKQSLVSFQESHLDLHSRHVRVDRLALTLALNQLGLFFTHGTESLCSPSRDGLSAVLARGAGEEERTIPTVNIINPPARPPHARRLSARSGHPFAAAASVEACEPSRRAA